MLALNGLRFGTVFEFGQRYQLAGVRVLNLKLFSPSFLPFNAGLYLFEFPRWSCYFPFALEPLRPPTPAGHSGTELVYGLFVMLPFLWFGALASLGWRKHELTGVIAVLAGSFAAMLIGLSFFAGATARYQLEMAPQLALLAAIGILLGARQWTGAGSTRAHLPALGLTGAIVMVSFTLTVCASWQALEIFSLGHRSPIYQRIARRANAAAVKLVISPSRVPESVELTLMLPRQPRIGAEPEVLLSTGKMEAADGIVMEYLAANQIQLGFFHDEKAQLFDPITVDPAIPHRLQVAMGSFYPPVEHPLWKQMSPEESKEHRQIVQISWDGTVISSGTGALFPPTSARPNIGNLPAGTTGKFGFSGTILQQQYHWFDPARN